MFLDLGLVLAGPGPDPVEDGGEGHKSFGLHTSLGGYKM